MFKKLGFFLFAMGLSASYAIAGGGDPECYSQCNAELEQCMTSQPGSPGACRRMQQICYASCDPILP
ncbi:hypothetical protein O3301_24760 [Janthinobacterium sp. SUN211]|uniref:hypothetical protein n=1 Tax=unclassified Janthinobacterium TaxID=2610881 RepID=UPI0025B1EADA|nr:MULTISPECIES: hypothetical protein [unclassified Janthinobacterium]MDN2705513.1 hypothetical protein [Janthinobacterium sp. SUN100]MDO8051682.1 hypothetical protein [Janthinobacterium sp. SUN211]